MNGQIVTPPEMQESEKKAFAGGVSAETLMDQAGAGIAAILQGEHPAPGHCLIYLGKGNNGGDALVAADRLQRLGWKLWVRNSVEDAELGDLPAKKLQVLAGSIRRVDDREEIRQIGHPLIILDGLLGLGGRAGLSEKIKALTKELNWCRQNLGAKVYAIDLPSGLAEQGIDPDCVVADLTITIGFVKEACVRDDATAYVGRIGLVSLPELKVKDGDSKPLLTTPDNLRHFVAPRGFESHKGDYGRIGIVAGSPGYLGAAVLCSGAAARAGGGLITIFVPRDIYPILAGRMPAEIMVRPVKDRREMLEEKLDAVALGPGLGKAGHDEILEVIANFKGPMVVDADGLNALSERIDILSHCAGPRLLTPHPGEMSRLWPDRPKDRKESVKAFTEKYPVTLLLKGARTLIGAAGQGLSYNSSGTPGMATGGSGDVLSGVCAALLGRGLSPFDAARFGAWLCGKASELSLADQSEESMLPLDTIQNLGRAYQALRAGCLT
jgi:ADP-dependent NAD(P)H-hydrate dehydratase / NAD(P)H-hydrate epimerase